MLKLNFKGLFFILALALFISLSEASAEEAYTFGNLNSGLISHR